MVAEIRRVANEAINCQNKLSIGAEFSRIRRVGSKSPSTPTLFVRSPILLQYCNQPDNVETSGPPDVRRC